MNIKTAIQSLDKEIQELSQASVKLESECGDLLKAKTSLAREKEMLLLKKETLERFKANPNQRKKFFQDEQSKIQVQTAGVIKDREDAERLKESSKKKIAELQKQEKERNEEKESLQGKMQTAERDMAVAKDERRKIAHSM